MAVYDGRDLIDGLVAEAKPLKCDASLGTGQIDPVVIGNPASGGSIASTGPSAWAHRRWLTRTSTSQRALADDLVSLDWFDGLDSCLERPSGC